MALVFGAPIVWIGIKNATVQGTIAAMTTEVFSMASARSLLSGIILELNSFVSTIDNDWLHESAHVAIAVKTVHAKGETLVDICSILL